MTIPDQYKVDHLFLLIGENPLPNYVAARTLLREGGKLYLVYTTQTQKPVERLQEVLNIPEEDRQKLTVALENYESNAVKIRKCIHEKIEEIREKDQDTRFGLNYTGGTKAMAVHSYQAFLEIYNLENPVVFSYLDSRSLKMMCERNKIVDPISVKDVEISLKDLFKIHGLCLSKDPKTEVVYPELVSSLVKKENLKGWKDWCHQTLQVSGKVLDEITTLKNDTSGGEIKIVRLKGWKKAQELKEMLLNIQKLPEEIIKILTDYNMIAENKELSISQLIEEQKIPKPSKNSRYPEEICKWLEGIWLEDFVLRTIKDIQNNISIDDYGMSFNFPPKSNIAEFEFDIAFLRGYRLFALSCTTDDSSGICKLKLFEAYRRAKQMGGDEARVALICCFENPQKIQDNFLAKVHDEKVKVFGSQDLPELGEKLKSWIKEVER